MDVMDIMPGFNTGFNTGFPSDIVNTLGFPSRMGMGNQLGMLNTPTPQIGMDLIEEPDKWVVHADLPGFKEEDVELTIENGMLGVRGTRDKTVESDTGITHRVEVHMAPPSPSSPLLPHV
jgi:HSP20 family molecular chaperone IbpA